MTMKVGGRVELNGKLLKCWGEDFMVNERKDRNIIKYINWVLILDALTRI